MKTSKQQEPPIIMPSEAEIAMILEHWFETRANLKEKNFRARNPVAKVLIKRLGALGNWRRAREKARKCVARQDASQKALQKILDGQVKSFF